MLTASNISYIISSFDESCLASETVLSYFQTRADTILKYKIENKEHINLKDISAKISIRFPVLFSIFANFESCNVNFNRYDNLYYNFEIINYKHFNNYKWGIRTEVIILEKILHNILIYINPETRDTGINLVNIHYLHDYLLKRQIDNTFDVIKYTLNKSTHLYPIPLKNDLVSILTDISNTSKSITMFNNNFSMCFKYLCEYHIPTIHQKKLNECYLNLKDFVFDINFFNNTYYTVDNFRDPRNDIKLGLQYIEEELELIFFNFTDFDKKI